MNYDELLYKYGMFSEYIPTCFNSNGLYKKIDKLKTSFDKEHKSECVELPIYKTSIERRIIKVPNPEQYVYLCERLKNNINDIEKAISHNKSTESNPFRINGDKQFLDIPLYCEYKNIKTGFMKSVKNRIRLSMGYKYQLKIDLSKFYDSIYTHIIEWCVVGKPAAKGRTKPGNWGELLDKAIRASQSAETKGIPTGPFTSRILSEFILSEIDKQLRSENLLFLHYVDDYRFYFKTESDAIKSLKKIANIFREYKLEINESKTAIKEYPYEVLSNISQKVYECRKLNEKESIIYVINECNKLYLEGEKASYKYVLKTLNKINNNELKNWIYLESFFLSVLTIKPDLARYISKIILKHKNLISESFKDRLIDILNTNIEEENECEILWIVWLLIKLDYFIIDCEIVNKLLAINNDFIIIITLYCIEEMNIENDETKRIKNSIEKRLEILDLDQSNWLLLYESIFNNWFDNEKIKSKINDYPFFKALMKNGVNFFDIKQLKITDD